MKSNFWRYLTILRKTIGLTMICCCCVLTLFAICGVAQKPLIVKKDREFKTWEIAAGQGSSFWAMQYFLLESDGNFTVRYRQEKTTRKVDETDLREIVRLLREIKLPGTKTRIVKGSKIFDGPDSSLVFILDGKAYKVAGQPVKDERQLALTVNQKKTLLKLKERLTKIGIVFFEPNLKTRR